MALQSNMNPWHRRLFGLGGAAAIGWAGLGGGHPMFYLVGLVLVVEALTGF